GLPVPPAPARDSPSPSEPASSSSPQQIRPLGPPPPLLGMQQIVPEPYDGPMSVRAAASFAQGAMLPAALPAPGKPPSLPAPRGSTAAVIVVVTLGLLAVASIGALAMGKLGGPKPTPVSSGAPTATTTATPGLAEVEAPSPSVPADSSSSAAVVKS